jgi:diphosphomevalonate decarboxylase
LADEDFWPLHVLIFVTSEKEKEVGSTEGMNLTTSTSPFYRDWLTTSRQDLEEMRAAILNRDLEKVGIIAEHNCLKMHALTITARPALIYWNGTTVELMHSIQRLRRQGISVYFTIDAGPQVKAICTPQDSEKIKTILQQVSGVKRVFLTSPGPAAKIVED